MNFFEYIVEMPINEETERRTNDIINMVKDGICCFNLNRISDEELSEDKKKRVFILTSYSNISQFLYKLFNGIPVKFTCYNKIPIYM